MCGYNGEVFSIHAHCSSDESCVGPVAEDPLSTRIPSFQKAKLCSNSEGKHDFESQLLLAGFTYFD